MTWYENILLKVGASIFIIVVLGIVGWMAVTSGQYNWGQIRFIIIGCIVSFWIMDKLFDRFRKKMTVRRMKWYEILWGNIRWYSKMWLGFTHTCKHCGCIISDAPNIQIQCRVIGCKGNYL